MFSLFYIGSLPLATLDVIFIGIFKKKLISIFLFVLAEPPKPETKGGTTPLGGMGAVNITLLFLRVIRK